MDTFHLIFRKIYLLVRNLFFWFMHFLYMNVISILGTPAVYPTEKYTIPSELVCKVTSIKGIVYFFRLGGNSFS